MPVNVSSGEVCLPTLASSHTDQERQQLPVAIGFLAEDGAPKSGVML